MKINSCKICGTALMVAILSVEAGPMLGCEHCHLPQHAPEHGGFSYDFVVNAAGVSASSFTTSSVIGLIQE